MNFNIIHTWSCSQIVRKLRILSTHSTTPHSSFSGMTVCLFFSNKFQIDGEVGVEREEEEEEEKEEDDEEEIEKGT